MSNNKYMVIPETEFSPAIQAKVKNYGQNPDYLLIDDTTETVVRKRRIDNSAIYVILKVAQNIPTAQILQLLPNHSAGVGDKYRRIYNGNNAFVTFLTENFQSDSP